MKRVFKLHPIKVIYQDDKSELSYAEFSEGEKSEIGKRNEFSKLLKEHHLSEIKSIEIAYELMLRAEADGNQKRWKIINDSISKDEYFRSFVVKDEEKFLSEFEEELRKGIILQFWDPYQQAHL